MRSIAYGDTLDSPRSTVILPGVPVKANGTLVAGRQPLLLHPQAQACVHLGHLHEGAAVGDVVERDALAGCPTREEDLDPEGAEHATAESSWAHAGPVIPSAAMTPGRTKARHPRMIRHLRSPPFIDCFLLLVTLRSGRRSHGEDAVPQRPRAFALTAVRPGGRRRPVPVQAARAT